MVARANRRVDGIGGHLATYASAATLYEVGFNHFFHGKTDTSRGDQVFFQGHASPGIYARAFMEGRLSESDLDGFRREVGGGLASYPHPRRGDFWEYPTVSMGLGLINAAHQARFNRYLTDRGIANTAEARVWCFAGDGLRRPQALLRLARHATTRRARRSLPRGGRPPRGAPTPGTPTRSPPACPKPFVPTLAGPVDETSTRRAHLIRCPSWRPSSSTF